MNWRLLLLAIALVEISGCDPYGDGAAAMRAHRNEVERRTEAMRLATAQTERGSDLADQALVNALSGRTLVYRYGSFPDGHRGDYVLYRYFHAGSRFVAVDNWLQSSGEAREGDYWNVAGGRLCILHQSYSSKPSCYLVARTKEGAIQFYIDDPDEPYHGMLTTSTREIIEGPPPSVRSVLAQQ